MLKFKEINAKAYADVCDANCGTVEYYVKHSILDSIELDRIYTKYMHSFSKDILKALYKIAEVCIVEIGFVIPSVQEKVQIKQLKSYDLGAVCDIIQSFNAKDRTVEEDYFEFL